MGREKPTFYLYGQGEPEDILCLGNLVLKDPRNPRVPGYFWTAKTLNDDERQRLTYSIPIDGEFSAKRGVGLGFAVEASDLINLDLSWARVCDKLVTAKAGARTLLRDPQAFLNERILPDKTAQEQLRLWLTAGNSLQRLFMLKVWMCTGLYALTDASVLEVRSTQASFSPGISSVTMAAASAIPVGGSISIGGNKELTNKFTATGTLVWAAQYRLLDLKHIDRSTSTSTVALLHTIRLLPDVVSGATLRGDETGVVQVALPETTADKPDSEDVVIDRDTNLDNGDERAWWSKFDQILQAIRDFYAD